MVLVRSIFSQNKLTSFILLSLGVHLLLFFCLKVDIETTFASPEKAVVRLKTVKPAVVEEEMVPVREPVEKSLPVEPVPAEKVPELDAAAAPSEQNRLPGPPESVILSRMELFSSLPVRSITASAAAAVSSVEPKGPKTIQFNTAAVGAKVPKPVYPGIAKRWGHEGLVVIEILIGEDGTVERADLLESSGHMELDEAAMKVILTKWKFQAAGYEIKTVKEFEFKLRR